MPAQKSPKTSEPALSVASVAVMVSDRERARRWYTEKLGLEVLADREHWLTVGRPDHGGRIHLCLGAELGDGFPLEPGNTGILLVVPGDLRETYERLKARGLTFSHPPVEHPWGWDAEVKDPDGNLLLLMSEA